LLQNTIFITSVLCIWIIGPRINYLLIESTQLGQQTEKMVNEQLTCVDHTNSMIVMKITMENTHTRTWSCINKVGVLVVCCKLMSELIGVVLVNQWERRVNALLFLSTCTCTTKRAQWNACDCRFWSWKMVFHFGTDEIMVSNQLDFWGSLDSNMKAIFYGNTDHKTTKVHS
jgi:hypothetical protein